MGLMELVALELLVVMMVAGIGGGVDCDDILGV